MKQSINIIAEIWQGQDRIEETASAFSIDELDQVLSKFLNSGASSISLSHRDICNISLVVAGSANWFIIVYFDLGKETSWAANFPDRRKGDVLEFIAGGQMVAVDSQTVCDAADAKRIASHFFESGKMNPDYNWEEE